MATIASYVETSESKAHEGSQSPTVESCAAGIENGIRSIQSRNWWTLWNTIFVVLLLMVTILSLTMPSLVLSTDALSAMNLDLCVRGLVGMVLLFNVYSIFQQLRMKKLCNEMKASLSSLRDMASRSR